MKVHHHKGITIFRPLYFLLLAMCFLAACGEESYVPNFQKFTVKEFIDQDPNFSILSEALEITGLGDSLAKEDDYTIMAPANRAFNDLGIYAVRDKTEEEWKALIRYHISKGALSPEDLLNEIRESLLEDYFWFVKESDGQLLINEDTKMLAKDISLKNGKVYALEAVLDPAKLNLINAASNNGYSIFVEALEKAGLAEELKGDELFTVFVVENQVFNDYFEAVGQTKDEWMSSEGLEPFMRYLILNGKIASEELIPGILETASGDTVFVSIDREDGVWLNGQAELIGNNIEGGNGFIQEVDKLFEKPEKSLATMIAETGSNKDYSEFGAAMIYVGLLSTLEGNTSGPFTVFAPTNEAFDLWYTEMGVSGYYELEEAVLRETLQYHIALGRVYTQDFKDEQFLTTLLEGEEIVLSPAGNAVNEVNVIDGYINRNAKNGVLHGVSEVLMP